MADFPYVKSIAELVTPRVIAPTLSWTAGGASDSATWTGTSVDRASFSSGAMPRSADIFVGYDATLASGSSFAVTFDVQDSADGVNWSDYATSVSITAGTGVSGGGRQQGVARFAQASQNAPAGTPGVDLGAARRYIRCLAIPHLTRTATDTAVMWITANFGGFDLLASPQR